MDIVILGLMRSSRSLFFTT